MLVDGPPYVKVAALAANAALVTSATGIIVIAQLRLKKRKQNSACKSIERLE